MELYVILIVKLDIAELDQFAGKIAHLDLPIQVLIA